MRIRQLSKASFGVQILITAGLATVLTFITVAYVQTTRPAMDTRFARFTVSRMAQTAASLDIQQGLHANAVTAGWIDLDAQLFLGSTSAARLPAASRLVANLQRCYRASLDVWQASLGGHEPILISSVHGLSAVVADDRQLQSLVVQTPTGPALSNSGNRAVLRMWQYAAELAQQYAPTKH